MFYFLRHIKGLNKHIQKPINDIRPLLGRWSLEYGEKAFVRADLTNEDHCGQCNQLRNTYLEKKDEKYLSTIKKDS